jgi:DNA-binding LytR/AlgR family response regulator
VVSVPTNQSAQAVLTIKSNNKFYKINIEEILYLESQKDYIKLYLKNREITAKYKISDIEAELKNHGFLRIHRSFIVNQQHIHSFSATHIEIGKAEIPIGLSYKELVMSQLA